MKKEIDWNQVMKESEQQEKLAGAINEQIEKERNDPKYFENSKNIMEMVEKEIKKNNLNALEITDNGSKK